MKNKNKTRYRKPFGETLFGKIAGGVLKTATSVIIPHVPLAGDVIENIRSRDGGPGRLDIKKLVTQIIRLILFAVVLWQFFAGKAEMSDLFYF